MGFKLCLAQQTLHALDIGRSDVLGALQATGALGGLALQQVAAVSLLATQLAGTGDLDALCGTLVSLLLHW
ncbi:hypothetical protein RC30_08660 [Campylobacter jejuni]|nr:hypothetical protein RC30_08660 [Campylobacter jejuni]